MKSVYWFIGGMLLLAIVSIGSGYGGYQYGTKKAENKQLETVNSYIDAIRDMQKQLDEERKKVKVKYREKIKYIHTASDDGCLDKSAPADILRQFRNN